MAGYFKKFGKYAFVKGKMKPPKAYTNNKTLSSLTKYDKEFYQFAVIDPGTCSCAIRICSSSVSAEKGSPPPCSWLSAMLP